MLGAVKPHGGYRRRRTGPAPSDDPATALHRYAVKLFDKGDGRAVDWPKVAATLFKVAFACVDEARGDERAAKVVRRVHDGAYNRMAGTSDSGMPYTSDPLPRPPAGPAPELGPEHDFHA